jgi:hypothetical protein
MVASFASISASMASPCGGGIGTPPMLSRQPPGARRSGGAGYPTMYSSLPPTDGGTAAPNHCSPRRRRGTSSPLLPMFLDVRRGETGETAVVNASMRGSSTINRASRRVAVW